jgi:nitroreductase
MEFEKVIKGRFSVRKFKDTPLPSDVINKILEAGYIAPTGCNFQPQRILVLNTEESLAKLKTCTKCHFDSPCAMLVCYNKDESWQRPYDGALSAPIDASIVTTHLMLQAQNLGVGSCWVMHFNPSAMKEAFNIPENIIPAALLVMGYPHEDSIPNERHTIFRPLEEIVLYNSF